MNKVKRFMATSSCFLILFCNLIGSARMKLPRYVVETDLKPALFGSYSYDAVKGTFIINNGNSSTTEINLTDILFNNTISTKIDDSYRKHVGVSVTETIKPFNWWLETREFLKNSTLLKNKLNSNTSTGIFN